MKNLQNLGHEEQDWTTVLPRRTEEPMMIKEHWLHEESTIFCSRCSCYSLEFSIKRSDFGVNLTYFQLCTY